MDEAKLILGVLSSAVSVTIAIASFFIARRADKRAKRAEEIQQLLGEKEGVAFAALKLLRDGLPTEVGHRRLVVSALMQACVFEGSDRTRALLYKVIEVNRPNCRDEFQSALKVIRDTFDSMDRYQFAEGELDLGRGRRRMSAVEKVVNHE